MSTEYEFNTIELYEKLVPCLTSKVNEFKRYGLNNITKEDIWNYFYKSKWKDGIPFLSDMVNDVMRLDKNIIEKFIEEEFNNRKVKREGIEHL
jgi:hypothetical protein